MLRKYLLKDSSAERAAAPGEKDIVALATVGVTSEATDHPIDNAFDNHRGPGGSRWVAGEPGPQRLLLTFDAPQTLRLLRLEVEARLGRLTVLGQVLCWHQDPQNVLTAVALGK
jgi:hypothetical protein